MGAGPPVFYHCRVALQLQRKQAGKARATAASEPAAGSGCLSPLMRATTAERESREGIRLSVCLLSVYLCGCAVPRIEKADLDHCPELNDKVAWSNQAQCYYKPVAGRSVSWYVTYSTLTHSRTHERDTAHSDADCDSFFFFFFFFFF